MALLGEDPGHLRPQGRRRGSGADPSDLPFLQRREIFAKRLDKASVAFNIVLGHAVPVAGVGLSREASGSMSAPQLLWNAGNRGSPDGADIDCGGVEDAEVEACSGLRPQVEVEVEDDEELECEADREDEPVDDGEEKHGEYDALESLLARTPPFAERYPSQSCTAQRIQGRSGLPTSVEGLSLAVRLANPDDCVLLVARCAPTAEVPQGEHELAVLRGGSSVSSTFTGHSRQEHCQHALSLPFVDQPNRRAEETHTTGAAGGGSSSSLWMSLAKQYRQFFALTVPSYQVTWVEDEEFQAISLGPWRDVEGLANVVTTSPGDCVLAICTIPYAASWASETNRGRFTLMRDDLSLDGPADLGLQSVRALTPQLRRTAIMATVDVPPPGVHCYRARATVTSDDELGANVSLQGARRLTLIRLPSSLVAGPSFVHGPTTVEKSSWTAIPGLSVTIATKRPRDRVLIVFNTDCHPLEKSYNAQFTVRRYAGAGGPPACLGPADDDGLEIVCSEYCASSEYPAGLLCDAPSTTGLFTYCVLARCANMGTSRRNPAVSVGLTGTLTAVRLSSS